MRLVRGHERVFGWLNPDVKQRSCVLGFLGEGFVLLDSVCFGCELGLKAFLLLNLALVVMEGCVSLKAVETLAGYVRIEALGNVRLLAKELLVVSQDGRRVHFIQICLVICHH